MDLEKLKIDRSSGTPRRRRSSPWPTVLVVLLAIAALWLLRAPLLRQLDRLTLLEVQVASATRTSAVAAGAISGTAANGYVVAATRAALSADTPGRVVELNVIEGSSVKAGDVVARLYFDEHEAALRQAEAEIDAARAAVARSESDVLTAQRDLERRRAEESAARARIASAQADLRLAEKELPRQQKLVASGVATTSALDTAMANQERSLAQVEAERAALAAASAALVEGQARIDSAEAALAESRSRVAVSEAAAELAHATLEKTYVRAPFDGIVVLKDAEIGEVVSPNSQGGSSRGSVATLVDLASLEVQIDLPETLLPKVREGAAARIFLDAFPGNAYAGRVLRIWPTANRQKATIEVRVGFDEPDARLRPDLGARVVFTEDEVGAPTDTVAADQVQVPFNALVRVDGERGVFVLERDVARWRTVAIGEQAGGRAIITDGLDGGERLVVSPPAELEDGDRVRIAQ